MGKNGRHCAQFGRVCWLKRVYHTVHPERLPGCGLCWVFLRWGKGLQVRETPNPGAPRRRNVVAQSTDLRARIVTGLAGADRGQVLAVALRLAPRLDSGDTALHSVVSEYNALAPHCGLPLVAEGQISLMLAARGITVHKRPLVVNGKPRNVVGITKKLEQFVARAIKEAA